MKTVVWIVEEITTYLKENSSIIHKACAHSVVEVFENCTPSKEDKLTISLIFYEPLAAIISSGCDKMAQQAATHCLYIFIHHIIQWDYETLINYLCPKLIALFLKSRCEYCDFVKCLIILLEACGIKYFVGCLTDIFHKICKIVGNQTT